MELKARTSQPLVRATPRPTNPRQNLVLDCKTRPRHHLLCDAMVTCRENEVERMSLYTDVSISAKTIYERLGFQPAGALTYRWRRTPRDS
jgi:hypothetical protein